MARPYIILTSSASLDGRMDVARPDLVSTRLEEDRVAELRGQVDGIITSVEKLTESDPEFLVKDSRQSTPIFIVDKNADSNPKSKVFQDHSRKVTLVSCKQVHKNRVSRIQDTKKNLVTMELGEHAVNLTEMLWEMHKSGIKKVLLEGDRNLNMRMLNHGLVDELYLLVAPLVVGGEYTPVFDGKLEERVPLSLDGIIQYGDHIVLHYILNH